MLSELVNGFWRSVKPIPELIRPESITVLDGDALWFGSESSAYRYDGTSLDAYRLGSGLHAIEKTKDGTIWAAAGTNLYQFDGDRFRKYRGPEDLNRTRSQTILAASTGDLWVGTQFFGVFHFDGSTWRRFDSIDGLPDNNVSDLLETSDGEVVAATASGYCRFDGQIWSPFLRGLPKVRINELHRTSDDAYWLNTPDNQTLGYVPDQTPPKTRVLSSFHQVSQPGNTVISWTGSDSWRGSIDGILFSHRLDGGSWSPLLPETSQILLALESGDHEIQIKSRDADFNIEQTPAQVAFTVLPPVWQEPWFAVLLVILVTAGITQTTRVVRRDRVLAAANAELAIARDHLERRVQQRTQELSEANDQLIKEITEREKTERELVHLERLRAVAEMSAGISHNLNNRLTGILAPAQIVRDGVTDPDHLFYLDTIVKSAERATDLVTQLHQAVKGGKRENFVPVSVNPVILDAIQTVRPRFDEGTAKSIEVITDLTATSQARATESELHDLVVNLLLNAVDALSDGGTVTVESLETETCVHITVSDNGVGMDEGTRRRAFEPFFTTKMDIGTGLGLFTVHGTVGRWGGKISVDSEIGKGTTLKVEIPRWTGAVTEKDSSAPPGPVPRSEILIIDDEIAILDMLCTMLSKTHNVSTESDSIRSISTFAPGLYDVVLIDLGMPEIPGDVLSQQLREADPGVVTVLITGWTLDQSDPTGDKFDFCVQKPLEMDTIHRVIAQAVELGRARRMPATPDLPDKTGHA